MKLITAALLQAQLKIENASKDANNPHFKNKYATLESVLESVKPVANDLRMVIVQTCGKDEQGHFLETSLIHESGEQISSKIYLVLDKQNMQGYGSALTYARRYSLTALFAIGQDDDDGNAASAQKAPPKKPASKPVASGNAPTFGATAKQAIGKPNFGAKPQATAPVMQPDPAPESDDPNSWANDMDFNFGNNVK